MRHKAVGRTTRRRKVADRDKQYKDMLEAVQNDTPQVLVIWLKTMWTPRAFNLAKHSKNGMLFDDFNDWEMVILYWL